jgi:hypothetical protein
MDFRLFIPLVGHQVIPYGKKKNQRLFRKDRRENGLLFLSVINRYPISG